MSRWQKFTQKIAEKYTNWRFNCRNYQDRLDEFKVLYATSLYDRHKEGKKGDDQLSSQLWKLPRTKSRALLSSMLDSQVQKLMKSVVSMGGKDPYPTPLSAEELLEYEKRNEISDNICTRVKTDHPDHYSLVVQKSGIGHPSSGYGVFIEGTAPPGSVIGFYPGPAYKSSPPQDVIDKNDYLISRLDGIVIDGRRWDLQADKYRKQWKDQTYYSAVLPSGELVTSELTLLKFQNPFAIGNHINHPPPGAEPNVFCFGYNFTKKNCDSTTQLFIPNEYASADTTQLMTPTSQDVVMHSMVVITLRTLKDEELYLNYRFNPSHPYPDWYEQPDLDEALRRWGKVRLFYPPV